jgi:hypothetical protein
MHCQDPSLARTVDRVDRAGGAGVLVVINFRLNRDKTMIAGDGGIKL